MKNLVFFFWSRCSHIAKKCPNKKLTPVPPCVGVPMAGNGKKWNYQAPGSGELQSKVVDGLTFHWCGSCMWLTMSHGTVKSDVIQQG